MADGSNAAAEAARTALTEKTMRGLALAWIEFEGRLEGVPLIARLHKGQLSLTDYRALLLNLRQQVVEGGSWIARAASNIGQDHAGLRSSFLRHAVTEHRDYQMLEANYAACGGDRADMAHQDKNIGSEALSAFMYHKASKPDPFDLLGAMFIIEGLGARKASEWGRAIKRQLGLGDDAVSFLLYHGDEDDGHLDTFEDWVGQVVRTETDADAIVKTARVVARLYALQLEEVAL